MTWIAQPVARIGAPLPQRKLNTPEGLPHPHADSPYYNAELDIYDPPVNRVGSPLTDALIIAPAARARPQPSPGPPPPKPPLPPARFMPAP